jgi:hypothetical protein
MNRAKPDFAIREAATIREGCPSLLVARVDREFEKRQIAAHFAAIVVVPVLLIMRGGDRS